MFSELMVVLSETSWILSAFSSTSSEIPASSAYFEEKYISILLMYFLKLFHWKAISLRSQDRKAKAMLQNLMQSLILGMEK